MTVVNTYCPGLPCLAGAERTSLMAVCSKDESGKYAVYLAIVPMSVAVSEEARAHVGEAVERRGVKQTWKAATAYFPTLREEEYRR